MFWRRRAHRRSWRSGHISDYNLHTQLIRLIIDVCCVASLLSMAKVSWFSCSCRTAHWWWWASGCSWPASAPPCLRMKLTLWQVTRPNGILTSSFQHHRRKLEHNKFSWLHTRYRYCLSRNSQTKFLQFNRIHLISNAPILYDSYYFMQLNLFYNKSRESHLNLDHVDTSIL